MDASTSLIRYDAARMALAECARINDAADIRDKAAALAAYARQRDDNDMECWVREIQLRACVRIGELVRELDTAQGERVDLTSSGQPEQVAKKHALAGAGIPQSTAYDYQALAGGRDERAQAAGNERAMLAWDKAVRGEHGRAREGAGRKPAALDVPPHDPETGEIKADNIRLENNVAPKPSSDYGTSAQAGLRRLEKAASAGDGNAADLLRRVVNPNDAMTVNGACVAMGWRKPTRTA